MMHLHQYITVIQLHDRCPASTCHRPIVTALKYCNNCGSTQYLAGGRCDRALKCQSVFKNEKLSSAASVHVLSTESVTVLKPNTHSETFKHLEQQRVREVCENVLC